MSPTLLSQRLKELEKSGIVQRRALQSENGVFEYHLTEAGRDIGPVVEAMGFWGQKWVESELSLKNLDPSLLMWDMRRNLNPEPLPKTRTVDPVSVLRPPFVKEPLVARHRTRGRG